MFFTRLAKGILIFFMVVIVIGSIVIGVAVADAEDGGTGFIFFLLALAVGLLLISIFGMFVELCNNILDIKKTLNTQELGYTGNNTSGSLYASAPTQSSNSKAVIPATPSEQNEGTWFCRYCGERNKASNKSCAYCYKER